MPGPSRELEFWNRRSNAGAIIDNLRWVLPLVWELEKGRALGILTVHVLMGLQPAMVIYVTEHLVDAVVETAGGGAAGFRATLPWLISYGFTLILTNEVMWQIRDTLHERLEQRLSYVLGRRLLAKASKLPLVFFEIGESYNHLSRARDPGQKINRFIFQAMHVFQAGLAAISVAGMFAPVSLWITLVLLAVLVPQIRLSTEQSRMFMAFTYGETEEERRARYVDRLLTGRDEQKEMRLFGLQGTLAGWWKDRRRALRERLMAQRRGEALGMLPVAGLRLAVSVGVAGVLAWLLGARVLTPGRFVALFRGVDDMLRAGASLGSSSREVQARSADVGYVREFLDLSESDEAWTRVPTGTAEQPRIRPFPRPLREGLTVEDLQFSYPAVEKEGPEAGRARAVLNGVSFHLSPGERVALVGENGAGKSTLAKILLGLYPASSGRVLADGVDYARINRESLADAVSAAFQDYFNFELTLAQSIGVGVLRSNGADVDADLWPGWLRPDSAIVEDAARKSGVAAIAERLSEGYDTPVGYVFDGGHGLSGGEWQRIAVGRAFTRSPELLILDEPAAALDPMAEAELYSQFGDQLEGRTVLLISHRLGSARIADRILVLRGGRIVEEGHHDDLIAAGGVYAEMWEEQASWYL